MLRRGHTSTLHHIESLALGRLLLWLKELRAVLGDCCQRDHGKHPRLACIQKTAVVSTPHITAGRRAYLEETQVILGR
jgi:hypothetical protein